MDYVKYQDELANCEGGESQQPFIFADAVSQSQKEIGEHGQDDPEPEAPTGNQKFDYE
jgi:hypothetical protein